MARPATRSAVLPEEVRDSILAVFGTQWTAYRQLSGPVDLNASGVSPSTFARALRGQTITPEQANAIQLAWDLRRVLPVAA